MGIAIRFVYISGLLLSIVFHLSAQQHSFRNLLGEDGLSDLLVNCIYKDSEGFVWIGTNSTVERFDGVQMEHYQFAEGGTPDYLVNTIIETPDKQVWVGNVKGLWKVDHKENKLLRMFPEKIDFLVQTLACDDRGNLYIGTPNGFFTLSDGTLTQHLVEKTAISANNQIIGISITGNGMVWLLTPGGVASYNVASAVIRFYAHDSGFTCMTRMGDTLYLSTAKQGLWTFDTQSGVFSKFMDVGNNALSCISTDHKDLLYIGTLGSGVHFVSASQRKVTNTISHHPQSKESISSDMISALLVDDVGIVWVGTKYYTGLDYMQYHNKPFQVYTYNGFDTYNLLVRSIYVGKDVKLIGTREGFFYVSEKDGIVKHFRQGTSDGAIMRSNLIFSLFEYEDKFLVGTCRGGLYVLDPVTLKLSGFDATDTFRDNDIMAFHKDGDGNLWIGASNGIYCYDKATGRTKAYTFANSGLLDGYVYYMFVDSKDRMWAATQTGLCLFDRTTGQFHTQGFPEGFIQKETVRYIMEDNDGNLLFCLLDGGLFRSDGDLSSFKFVATSKDMGFKGTVYHVRQDKLGYLWLATDYGIIRSNADFTSYTSYSVSEGMPAINCTAGANIFSDETGQLWFCTVKGVISIDPAVPPSPVSIKITGVNANGTSVFPNGQPTNEKSTGIILKNDQNNLVFRFVALTYDDPKIMSYEYKLENYDEGWNMVHGQNEARYYNLPAGKYTFRVRKPLDNSSVQSVTVLIKPLVWPYVAGGLAIAAFIGVFVWWRHRKNLAKPMEKPIQEKLPEKETGNPTKKEEDKYKNTKLDEDRAKAIIVKLADCMEREKPYLNPDLKLHDLATAIGCSPSVLSQIFNIHLKERYYDYINRYRVEEFKRIAKTGDYMKYTMISLAEQCGFGSQASFFRFFKKATGTTPLEYIQNIENKHKKEE